MQDRTYLKQKYRKISVALISNFLILGAMAAFMRPSFETNDDIVFAELGSGLRGVKDAHLVFQNYGLGMIYRLLYGVTGRLPWYTIVQYMILFAAFTVVTYVLISRLGEISGLCLFVILMKDIFICSSPKQQGSQQQRQYFSYFICWSRRSIPGGGLQEGFYWRSSPICTERISSGQAVD